MSIGNSPGSKSGGKKKYQHHTNFIEALKSAGGSMVKDTVKSFKDDLIKGTANELIQAPFGGSKNSDEFDENNPYDVPQNDKFNFNEYLNSGENLYAKQRQHDRVKQIYEQQETVIFNRRQEQVQKRIEEIQVELKKIAKEIVYLDQTTQKVIDEEIIDPGVYHLSFFEKMLSFLQKMRKRISESRHWAAMHSQRGQSKSYYWQQANAKKGGTKFLLSQERQVATQTG